MSNDAQIITLSFLTLSQKYLHTTKNILGQTIKTGNQWIADFDDEDKMWDKYFEVTKWSDFQTIIPTLFLFFHGLELLCKGLIFLANEDVINNLNLNHNIEELCYKVEKTYVGNPELVNTLKKYSHLNQNTPYIIQNFINKNQGINNIQTFYQSLRYPSATQLKTTYNYFPIKYKEKEGLLFAKELESDIATLLTQSIEIYKTKNHKENNYDITK